MRFRSETGFANLLSERLHETRSIFPWVRKAAELPVPAPKTELTSAPALPLPPSKPLSRGEQQEANTLAQLRGALYPSEA